MSFTLGSRSRQFVDEHDLLGKMSAGQVYDVAMMGEEQDLGSPRQFGQGTQCGGGAKIVKVEQDVVNHERNRFMGLKPGLQAR